MFKHTFLTLLLLAPSLAAASDGHAKTYLSDAQVSAVMAALPAPSAPGSAEDKADYAATDRAFAERSAADFAQAKQEEKFNAFDFAPLIGPGFQADKLPRVAALFKEAEEETKEAVDLSKNHWKRPRPCPPASDCASNPEKAAKKSSAIPAAIPVRPRWTRSCWPSCSRRMPTP